MEKAPTYASEFVKDFTEPLEQFITNSVSELAKAVMGPLYAGATLYIMIFGILILLGYVRAPVQDFVVNVLKITIIVFLVSKIDQYNYYVTKLFFEYIPDGINAAITQASQDDSFSPQKIANGSAFDTVVDNIIKFATTLYKKWTWDDWYPLIAAILVLLGLIPTAALLAVALLAKLGLALLLALGPVFIALYLFRSTQSFTAAWINALANFVILQVLAFAFVTLLMNIMNGFIEKSQALEGGAQVAAALSLVLTFVLSLILVIQLPSISSQLAGSGFQIGAGLINAGVNTTKIAAAKGAWATGKGVGATGKGIGAAAKWAWNKRRGSGGSIENKG